MERTFSPMIRQYSAIDGLQQAYTLVYAMEVEHTRLPADPVPDRQPTADRQSACCGSAGVLLPAPALLV